MNYEKEFNGKTFIRAITDLNDDETLEVEINNKDSIFITLELGEYTLSDLKEDIKTYTDITKLLNDFDRWNWQPTEWYLCEEE